MLSHLVDNDKTVFVLLAGAAVIGGVLVLGALALANQALHAFQQLF